MKTIYTKCAYCICIWPLLWLFAAHVREEQRSPNYIFGVNPKRPECATVNSSTNIVCLPSFIIAGVQKGGTTVLAALLSAHPKIIFSRQKETHFFDRKGGNDVRSYIQMFPAWNASASETADYPIYGEGTPFYIASRTSCKKIHIMLPNTKIIIILREPVSRANSEYQMKLRRVAHQNDFLLTIEKAKKKIVYCMVKHNENYQAIKQCVPEKVSNHERWIKLQKAWELSFSKSKDWSKVIEGCFPNYLRVETEKALKTGSRLPFISSRGRKLFTHKNGTSRHQELLLNASSCWRHYRAGFESIKPLREALVGEIEAFQSCRYNRSDSTHSPPTSTPGGVLAELDASVERCLQVRGGISTQYFYRSMYAVQLYHCFKSIPRDQFLILPSGRLRREPGTVLSEVLVFLGILPSLTGDIGTGDNHKQILVSRDTCPRAVAAYGQQHQDLWSGLSSEITMWEPVLSVQSEDAARVQQQAVAAISKFFPTFGRNTGWKFQSEYAPLPEDVQQHMQSFYEEQNNLLFDLLGQDLTQVW